MSCRSRRPLVVCLLPLALAACGKAPLTPTAPAALLEAPGASGTNPAGQAPRVPAITTMGFPRFTFKSGGQQGDPVNLLLTCTRLQLERLFDDAGWRRADPITAKTAAKMLAGTLDPKMAYPTAPMSALFLYGRMQDYAFQKNNVGVRKRDHLRAWQSTQLDRSGRPIWCVAATRDVAIEWVDRHPTHRIDPEIDVERALVKQDLLGTGRVAASYQLRSLPGPYMGANGEGDGYRTDGLVEVLELATDAPGALLALPAHDAMLKRPVTIDP